MGARCPHRASYQPRLASLRGYSLPSPPRPSPCVFAPSRDTRRKIARAPVSPFIARMRYRVLLASASALLLSGCGYIHFGRLPDTARPLGEAKTAEALSNLATENKILKQELVLARREGDALRVALERAGASTAAVNLTAPATSSTPPPDLVARLNETSAELATLRASYAKLQAERATLAANATSPAPPPSPQLRELEEKLAASLRDHTELQSDNTRLRGEIDSARRENASLAERLQLATRQYDQAQAALAQLNTELLAQQQARTRAEQATEALRAQLGTVVAQATPGTSLLQLAKEPPAPASATAELRISPDRLHSQPSPPPAPVAKPARKHTVVAGDTLEKISQRYYGAPDRWAAIYNTNADLLKDGLHPGLELTIPE